MQLREQLDVQGQGQHGLGAFAEHGPGHVVRLGEKRLAGGHLCPSQVLNPSEQGLMLKFLVTKISVCSAFSLLRILATRVAALSCLECTSPAPTRLDENRTVSGPFPDHVFTPSLVPAQQRWQNHPGSKRNHPTVARIAWIESRKHPCNRRLCPTRMKMALPISVGNSNSLFHWLSTPTFCVH